jgi:hypothetical protein
MRCANLVVPVIVIISFLMVSSTSFAEDPENSSVLKIDYPTLVSRGDLYYNTTVDRSEAGIPVGNGHMGTLVWTSPTSLKMQLNRGDVYANNRTTHSFNWRDRDYAHGVGFFDIDFVDYGEDVFVKDKTKQHLSIYDGLLTIEGNGVKTQVIAWHEEDVMAYKIEDFRESASAIKARLRMLRPAEVFHKNHKAISTMMIKDDYIILKQEFSEGEYFCSSAVAISVQGRESIPRYNNPTGGQVVPVSSKRWRTPGLGQETETEISLAVKPGKGEFEIMVASAASFDRDEDIVGSAIRKLELANERGFDYLLNENKEWWSEFWAKSFVHLHSSDGVADEIEKYYSYYLYLLASSARDHCSLDFSGMLWSSLGDLSAWGHQQWYNNISLYYRGMFAANRPALMDPYFNLYSGMYEACENAAQQMWGTKGIFIPETVWFDGPEELPEDVGKEMQDLYLLRKPWESRSDRFMDYAAKQHPHPSTWNWKGEGIWVEGNWVFTDKGAGPFGEVIHIFESGPKLAYMYWKRYEYTLDHDWLRDRAYPMLKGIAEFFRNYPNLTKEADGKYHITGINDCEGVKGARDPMGAMASMHAILPIAIKASEILETDGELRGKWQEFYANLAPLPRSDNPDAAHPTAPGEPIVWSNSRNPVLYGHGEVSTTPLIYFDMNTLETQIEDPDFFEIGMNTYNGLFPEGMNPRTYITVMGDNAIIASKLGQPEDVRYAIINQIKCLQAHDPESWDFNATQFKGELANRMNLREGINAIGAENLGNAAYALQEALCQSNPPKSGEDAVIRVFPAWPSGWDAQYKLLCRGGFLVTSSRQHGDIEFVEIDSQAGGVCRIRNPWDSGEQVVIHKNGRRWKKMSGSLLSFKTNKDDQLILVKANTSPEQYKRVITPGL